MHTHLLTLSVVCAAAARLCVGIELQDVGTFKVNDKVSLIMKIDWKDFTPLIGGKGDAQDDKKYPEYESPLHGGACFLEPNERARARGSCATCDVFTGAYKSLWWMSTMASATTPPLSELKRTPLGITKHNNEFSVNPNLYSLNTRNSAHTKWESTTTARHARAKLMEITLDVAQRRFCKDTSVFGKRDISSSRGQGCEDCSISSNLCSEAFAGVVKQYEHRIMADLDLGCYYKLKTFGPEQPVVTGVMDCPIRVMCSSFHRCGYGGTLTGIDGCSHRCPMTAKPDNTASDSEKLVDFARRVEGAIAAFDIKTVIDERTFNAEVAMREALYAEYTASLVRLTERVTKLKERMKGLAQDDVVVRHPLISATAPQSFVETVKSVPKQFVCSLPSSTKSSWPGRRAGEPVATSAAVLTNQEYPVDGSAPCAESGEGCVPFSVRASMELDLDCLMVMSSEVTVAAREEKLKVDSVYLTIPNLKEAPKVPEYPAEKIPTTEIPAVFQPQIQHDCPKESVPSLLVQSTKGQALLPPLDFFAEAAETVHNTIGAPVKAFNEAYARWKKEWEALTKEVADSSKGVITTLSGRVSTLEARLDALENRRAEAKDSNSRAVETFMFDYVNLRRSVIGGMDEVAQAAAGSLSADSVLIA